MQARELLGHRPYLDVLLYGDPGTGKTARGARSPRPFIALTEPHGLPTIAEVDPEADVEIISTAPEFFDLMVAVKKGVPTTLNGQPAYQFSFRGKDRLCQTIVLDSVTDLGERVLVWLSKEKETETGGFDWDHLSPGVNESDIETTVWRRYGNIMSAALHDLRSLPVHILVLALSHETYEGKGETKIRIVRPQLYGKLRVTSGQFFSLVGKTEKTPRGNYVVRWNLPEPNLTKKLPGLPDYTVDNLAISGKTTLGSLALFLLREATTPHREGDRPEFVLNQESPKAEEQPKENGPEQPAAPAIESPVPPPTIRPSASRARARARATTSEGKE